VFGGKVKSFDAAKVAGMPGVKKVVQVKDTAVAVVADTWWHAKKALDALPIVWDEGPNARRRARRSTRCSRKASPPPPPTETAERRRQGAIAGAAKKVEAVYSTPFLAHACMEMMNATVRLSPDKAELWVPTQNAEASIAALSETSGVPLAKCECYRHDLGGGFGRRGGTQDYVRQAVEIAKEFPGHPGQADLEPRGGPGARLLPADLAVQAVAGLDEQGNLVGLHVACRASRSTPPEPGGIVGGKDKRQLQG
jgi:isoquinoline 1-oxidoreductase beta subunit